MPYLESIENRLAPALVTWDGGGGDLNWNTPANWSSDSLPGVSDDAQISIGGNNTILFSSGTSTINSLNSNQNLMISGGSFSVSAASSILGSMTLSSGILTGGGSLDIGGLTTWGGGAISGAGQLNANGGLTLSGGTKTWTTKPLAFAVGATWNAGDISTSSGATLNVPAGLVFDVQCNATISRTSGTVTINNSGTVRKSAGTVDTTFGTGIALNNSGSIDIQTGRLVVQGNMTSSGSVAIAAPGTLYLSGATNSFTASSNIGGAGDFYAASGSTTVSGSCALNGLLTVNNGTATFNANATFGALYLSGGTLTGTGNLTITGPTTWIGSTIAGTGLLSANGGITLNGTSTKNWTAKPVSFGIGITWIDGNISMSSGTVLTIPSGLVLDIQSDAAFSGTGTVNNNGTIRKSNGSGTTTSPSTIAFNSAGTVDIQVGAISFSNITSGSSFTVASGAAIEFSGTTNTLTATSSVTGAGGARFASGTTTIAGAFSLGGTINVVGGTATFNTAVSMSTLAISNGTLSGSGNINVSGATTMTNGGVAGTGLLNANGGILISGGAWNKPIIIGADSVLNGSSGGSGGSLSIPSGVVFDIQGNPSVTNLTSITNAGVLRRSSGSGIAALGGQLGGLGAVINTGLVDIQSGTLRAGNFSGNGSIAVSANATLDLDYGANSLAAPSSITGTGTILVSGGTTNVGAVSTSVTLSTSGGTITCNSNVALGGLSNSGGILNGAGNLSVSGLTDWSGGTFSGTGQILASGGLSLSGGSKTWSGKPIVIGGAATWSGGDINCDANTTLIVPSGVIFEIRSDATMTRSGGTTVAIANSGILRKTVGTGTTTISPSIAFTNTGTIDVQSGTLRLQGGLAGSGIVVVAAGGTLDLNNGSNAVATASGSGILQLSGGTTTVSGPTASTISLSVAGASATLNANVDLGGLTVSSGTLTGTGNINVTGTTTWSGGTISGTGQINANGGLTLSGGTKTWTARPMALSGGANWTAGNIAMSGGAVLNILSGAVFDIQSDSSLTGTGSINNSGTFRKSSGTGTTSLASTIALGSSGSVDILSGTLRLGSTTAGGSFSVAANAMLSFAGGTSSLSALSSITGAGNLEFIGGSTTLAGTTALTGGMAISNGSASATFNGNTTLGNLTVTTGTLSGSGNITVNGATNWGGGTISGTGQLNANGGLTLSGNSRTLSGKSLTFGVGATWSGGDISFAAGAVLNIPVGTVFAAQFDGNLTGTGAVNNAGVFRKSAGTGTTSIGSSVTFTNSGSVEPQIGTINLNGSTSSGSFIVAAGATINFGGGTNVLTSTSSMSGNGNLGISGGAANFAGAMALAGSVAVNGGTASFDVGAALSELQILSGTLTGAGNITVGGATNWSGGTITGTGQLNANGGLTLSGGTKTFSNRPFTFSVGATWLGGDISFSSGSTLSVSAGLTFLILADANITGNGTINNFGTIRKAADTGNTTIASGVAFGNVGTVDLQIGTLSLQSSFSGGTFHVGAGCTLEIAGGTSSLGSVDGGGNVRISGGTTTMTGSFAPTGSVSVTSGALIANANVGFASFSLSNGTLSGTGTVTVAGSTVISGGTMSGSGQFVANGLLTFSGGAKNISGKSLNCGVTTTWIAGDIAMSSGAALNIGGGRVFDVKTTATISGGSSESVNVSGIFRKSSVSGTTTVSAVFNNNGLTEVQTGTLLLQGGGIHSGSFSIFAAATLNFGGAVHLLPAGTNVSGAGNIEVSGGSVTVAGSFSSSGILNLSGGVTTVNSNIAPAILTINAILTGSGAVNVAGLTTWSGGTISGSGQLNANGGLLINGASTKTFGGKPVVFGVGASWTGGTIAFTAGAALNVPSGLVFDVLTDSAVTGSGTINVAGTFRKTAGVGTTSIAAAVPLNNTGLLSVQTGTLSVANVNNSSSIAVAAGTLLDFNGGTNTLTSATSVTGVGTVQFSSGAATVSGAFSMTGATIVNGAIVTIGANAVCGNLFISSGTLTGAAALDVNGLTTFSGGSIAGTGALNANGGLLINGATTKSWNVKPVTFGVSGTLSAGTLNMDSGAVLTVPSGLVFNLSGGVSIARSSGTGTATINNLGVVRNNASISMIDTNITLNSSGAIELLSGQLTLKCTANVDGSIAVAAGSTLENNGGTLTLSATSSVSGAGNVRLTGGTSTVSGSLSTGGTLFVLGGSAAFNAATAPNSLVMSGGSLTGSGAITVAGLTNFTGGTISGGGSFSSNGGFLVSVNGDKFVSGRTLSLTGGGSWTAGALYLNGGATLINSVGSTFDVQCDSFFGNSTGNGTINNFGVFRKSAGAGTTTFTNNLTYNDAGTTNVLSGTLVFQDATNTFAGVVTVALGAALGIASGNSTFTSTSNVSGAGDFSFSGGYTFFDGSFACGGVLGTSNQTTFVAFNSNATTARLSMTEGIISGFGFLDISGPSLLNGGSFSNQLHVNAIGGMTIGGNFGFNGNSTTFGIGAVWTSGQINFNLGAIFNIPAGLVFDVKSPYWTTGDGAVTNYGVFRKSAGAGEVTLSTTGSFNNFGSIDVQVGGLSLANLTSSGTVNLAKGTLLTFAAGTNTLSASSVVTGAGSVKFSNGSSTVAGSFSPTGSVSVNTPSSVSTAFNVDVVLSSLTIAGSLSGTGNVDVTGPTTWSAGPITGSGYIHANGGLIMNGSSNVAGKTISFGVGATMTGSGFKLDSGAVFNVPAGLVFEVRTNTNIGRSSGIGTGTFNNAGTFLQSVGTTTFASGVQFNNSGTIQVNAGVATSIGNLANLATNNLSGGNYVIAGTLLLGADIVTNAATVTLVGPNSSLQNSVSGASALANFASNASGGSLTLQSGRNLTVPGTFTNGGALHVQSNSTFSTAAGNYVQTAGVTDVNGILDPFEGFDLQGGLLSGSGTVAGPLSVGAAAIAPGNSPGILGVAGDLTMTAAASLIVELNGTTAGTQYDRVDVTGTIDLGGATLSATLGYSAALGDSFIIVQNDDTDAVVGSFAGLAEGAALVVGGSSFVISYIGGTGNDVVLTRATAATDSIAPGVANVYFDGSAWSTAFRGAAGSASGYAAQSAAAQLTALPWSTINTIRVQFTEDVVVDQADIGLRGINLPNYGVAAFSYDSLSFIASWTLVGNIDTDRIIIDLDGEGATGVTDLAGNKLAGSWTEGVSTFPTAGTAGNDFKYRFVVAVGDADRNGIVRNPDTNLVRANLFIDAGAGGYNIFADIDGNGQTRNADTNLVRSHLFIDPPAGPGPNRPIGGGGIGNRDQHAVQSGNRYVASRLVDQDRIGTTLRRMPAKAAVDVLDRLFAEW